MTGSINGSETVAPARPQLSREQLEKLSKDELLKHVAKQDTYLTFLEKKAKKEGEFRETEEKLRQQQIEASRRENVLVVRLTAKEQEVQDYANQLEELRTGAATGSFRSTLLDPAVNLMFQRMRHEIQTTKEKLEQSQQELNAWKFTPDSNNGKRLMAKCRQLLVENEELGKMISAGRFAKLEGDLALSRSLTEELKKSQAEIDDLMLEMDEEMEGLQATVYFLQDQLKTAKAEIAQLRDALATHAIDAPLSSNNPVSVTPGHTRQYPLGATTPGTSSDNVMDHVPQVANTPELEEEAVKDELMETEEGTEQKSSLLLNSVVPPHDLVTNDDGEYQYENEVGGLNGGRTPDVKKEDLDMSPKPQEHEETTSRMLSPSHPDAMDDNYSDDINDNVGESKEKLDRLKQQQQFNVENIDSSSDVEETQQNNTRTTAEDMKQKNREGSGSSKTGRVRPQSSPTRARAPRQPQVTSGGGLSPSGTKGDNVSVASKHANAPTSSSRESKNLAASSSGGKTSHHQRTSNKYDLSQSSPVSADPGSVEPYDPVVSLGGGLSKLMEPHRSSGSRAYARTTNGPSSEQQSSVQPPPKKRPKLLAGSDNEYRPPSSAPEEGAGVEEMMLKQSASPARSDHSSLNSSQSRSIVTGSRDAHVNKSRHSNSNSAPSRSRTSQQQQRPSSQQHNGADSDAKRTSGSGSGSRHAGGSGGAPSIRDSKKDRTGGSGGGSSGLEPRKSVMTSSSGSRQKPGSGSGSGSGNGPEARKERISFSLSQPPPGNSAKQNLSSGRAQVVRRQDYTTDGQSVDGLRTLKSATAVSADKSTASLAVPTHQKHHQKGRSKSPQTESYAAMREKEARTLLAVNGVEDSESENDDEFLDFASA